MKTHSLRPIGWIAIGAFFAAIADAQTIFVPSGSVGTSSNGNVGIGTTSPNDKLTVIGNVSVINNTSFAAGSNAMLVQSGSTPALYFVRSSSTWADTWWDWTMGTDNKLRLGFCTVPQLTVQNGALGIGMDTPGARLDVAGDIRFGVNYSGTVHSGDPNWGLKLNHPSGDIYETLLSYYSNPGGGRRVGFYDVRTASYPLYVDTSGANTIISGNVGIGTTAPSHKLSVNGTIKTKEIIVETTGWADDVFASGYRLKALGEVQAFIAAHGHLPDVPSAAIVAEQGVAVGEMQATLLRKIEELTLYLIQQEDRARQYEDRARRQDRRIEELEARLAAISSSTSAAPASP